MAKKPKPSDDAGGKTADQQPKPQAEPKPKPQSLPGPPPNSGAPQPNLDPPRDQPPPRPLTARSVAPGGPNDGTIEDCCRAAPEGAVVCVKTEGDMNQAIRILDRLGKNCEVSVRKEQEPVALWRNKPAY